MDLIPLGDHLMKSVMERAAGRVVLTIVLIRGFCWGRDFVGLLRNRMPININIIINIISISSLMIIITNENTHGTAIKIFKRQDIYRYVD